MIIRSVPGIEIHETAHIDVDELIVGKGTIIRAHAQIYGKRVILGRECFIDEYAVIGGGSASDGELEAGDWLHVGMYAQINTARRVLIGDEVGIGIGTRVFTHGAYLSEYDGFPVDFGDVIIGSRVWLPNAVVMPGVIIGDDVVCAAGSILTKHVSSGSLVAGVPARVIRENAYPAELGRDERESLLERICAEVGVQAGVNHRLISVDGTVFSVADRSISGPVSDDTERVRNQLRRHGIRFRFEPTASGYQAW